MTLQPIYTNTPKLDVGQLVEGIQFGKMRRGEVIQANERHFIVRWENGVRNTCMQGFDYGSDMRKIGAEDQSDLESDYWSRHTQGGLEF